MAFSEFELKRYEKVVKAFVDKHRPPPHIRKDLDLGYRLKGQSVELFEIRPRWDNPKELLEHAVAKATYVKTQGVWKLYWQRADLKWHSYEPYPAAKSLDAILKVVGIDAYGCFFG